MRGRSTPVAFDVAEQQLVGSRPETFQDIHTVYHTV